MLRNFKKMAIAAAAMLMVGFSGMTAEAKELPGGKEEINISTPKTDAEITETPDVPEIPDVSIEIETPSDDVIADIEISEDEPKEETPEVEIPEEKEDEEIPSVTIPVEKEEMPEIKVEIPSQKEEIPVITVPEEEPKEEPKPEEPKEEEPKEEPQPEEPKEEEPKEEPQPEEPKEEEPKEEPKSEEPKEEEPKEETTVVAAKETAEKWGLELLPALPDSMPATGDSSDIILWFAAFIAAIFATVNVLAIICKKSNDNENSDIVVDYAFGNVTKKPAKNNVVEEQVIAVRTATLRQIADLLTAARFAGATLIYPKKFFLAGVGLLG